MRSLLAVIAGAVVWTVLWLGLNQGLLALAPQTFAPGQPITNAGALIGLWLASVLFSVISGYVTAGLARHKMIEHAAGLGVLLLAIGIFVQLQYWDLMPVWYHVLFLLCILPGNAYGGVLRHRKGETP